MWISGVSEVDIDTKASVISGKRDFNFENALKNKWFFCYFNLLLNKKNIPDRFNNIANLYVLITVFNMTIYTNYL